MQYDAELELNVGSNRDNFCHCIDFSNRVKETAKFTSGGRVFLNTVETAVNTDDGTSTHVNVMASTSADTNCNNKNSFNTSIVHSTISEGADSCFEHEQSHNISTQLAQWATDFNISLVALSALLCILKLHKLNVPKDARTLLARPIDYVIKNVAGGSYYYLFI